MGKFKRRADDGDDNQHPQGATSDEQAVRELLDRRHQRASITSADGQMTLEPSQLLTNIVDTMERIDLDVDTEVAVEDAASVEELAALVGQLRMGPLLMAHVVNNAMRIMSARYPAELVRSPLPPVYDLRKLVSLKLDDREHAVAKEIFNRRTASPVDLTEADVADVDQLSTPSQLQVFVALFYMYGTKVGALKFRTGIE